MHYCPGSVTDKGNYNIFNSPTLFCLAKSIEWICMSSSHALFCMLICIFFYMFRLSVPLNVVTTLVFFLFFCSVYNKIIIRFSFCDIQNNQGRDKGLSAKTFGFSWQLLPQTWLFWISQKPHPIIVYFW